MGNPPAPSRNSSGQQLQRVPSARTIARLMTAARDHLSKADTVTVAAIGSFVRALVEARVLLNRFPSMVWRRTADLEAWISDARTSLMASYAAGVTKDKAAVATATTSPRSSGQTEGQVTKLNLVKRQTYGRAKIDLLEARLFCAP